MNFHHTGFIVKSILEYERNLIFEEKILEVIDPIQNAKLSLYSNFSNCFIELIEPLGESSLTWNSLQKFGNHFHHLCYSVENLEELQIIVENKMLIKILDPVPAILFNKKFVTFYMGRNKQIIEFLILNK
jgi:hypothetical protein